VGQVLVDDERAVAQVEGEALEAAVALALALHVPGDHRGPPERDAAELVGHVLAVAHADDEAVALPGALGAELARVLLARGAAQVRLHLLVGAVVVGDGAVARVAHLAAGLRDVDGHVGVDDVEQAAGAPAEEQVEVGPEQPPRRVGGHQRHHRRQEQPRRGEVGGEQGRERAQVGQRPPPPLRHRSFARLRHHTKLYGRRLMWCVPIRAGRRAVNTGWREQILWNEGTLKKLYRIFIKKNQLVFFIENIGTEEKEKSPLLRRKPCCSFLHLTQSHSRKSQLICCRAQTLHQSNKLATDPQFCECLLFLYSKDKKESEGLVVWTKWTCVENGPWECVEEQLAGAPLTLC
jgi:hypothetical protein